MHSLSIFLEEIRRSPEQELAHRIYIARCDARLTQSQLGKLVFVTQQVISDYERAKYVPDSLMLARISKAVKKPFSFFEIQA